MNQQVKITAVLNPRAGRQEELALLLSDLARHSREEPGNLRWDIWREQGEGGRFVLDELYRDDAAVRAHRETAHFQHYLSRINELAERTALVLDPYLVGQGP